MTSSADLSRVLPGTTITTTDTPLLNVSNISLSFGGNVAVRDLSFTVTAGELLAIIGPNGAGKTSVFNAISGVYRPDAGQIKLLGDGLIGLAPHDIAAKGVARTFQNIELFDNLTVVENLLLGRHLHLKYGAVSGMLYRGRAEREELANREIVETIIEFLEIAGHRQLPVGMLPYGVKKRIELGRALAMEPKLLLLDEPVAGMNVEETEDMARFILDIRSELGTTILLVEHDMGLVMDLADRVMVMHFGERIALDTPDQVQQDPAVIAAYLGVADPDELDNEGAV
ncbi:MAG: ABC transporter ATP-binding protein [Nitriliruptoraceae bacterium]